MKRLKTWLLMRFLPAWAKDTIYTENKQLLAQLEQQKQEIRELHAYIDGLEAGLRALRRVTIRNEVRP